MDRRGADEGAEDRQRALNEVCRRVLKDFVGLKITPYLMAEAEGVMRRALDEAIQAGIYVLPEGLVLDRVELGNDMCIQVFFARSVLVDAEVVPPVWPEMKLRNRFEAVAAELEAMKKDEI